MDKGVISFKGDKGHPPNQLAKSVFNNITDLDALDTFTTYVTTNVTDCKINYISWCDRDEKNEAAPGTDVNVDRLAIFVLKEAAGTIHKYAIPGPKAAISELLGEGERITAAIQTAFAAALSTATGLTFTPLQGYIFQKK